MTPTWPSRGTASAAVPAHQPAPSYLEADRSDKPPFVRNQNPTASAVQAGWASIRTAAYQYPEYYDIANPATASFREYYNLTADPSELVNLVADGNPSNDPDTALLAQTLRTARQCIGGGCP